MKRIRRDLKRALQEAFSDAQVEFEVARKHDFVVVTRRGGLQARVSISGTPKDPANAVKNVVADIRARFETPARHRRTG